MKLNACGSPAGAKLFTPITLPLSSMVGPPLMPSVTAASISYSGLVPMVDFLLTLPLLFVGSSEGPVTRSVVSGNPTARMDVPMLTSASTASSDDGMLCSSTLRRATSPWLRGRKSTTLAGTFPATFVPVPYNTVMLISGPRSALSPSTLAFF